MKKIFANRRAEGYIYPCLLVIFIAFLVSALLTFISAVHTVNSGRRAARTVSDNYVITDSVAIFDTLKNSSDDVSQLDSNTYTENLRNYCNLEEKNNLLYCYDGNGKETYHISKPVLTFVRDGELKIRVTFDITVPLRFSGVFNTEVTVPITVDSLYNDKF